MSKSRMIVGLAVVALLGMVWAGQALSQEGGRGVRQRDSARPARGRMNPEQMRQRMLARMKENLSATDAEWKVLGPRLEKVQTLSFQVRGRRGMAGMFGRRAPRRGTPERPAATRKPTAVEQALQELRTTLEDEAAKPAQITKNLTALRKAREKVKQELATAQDELREILSVRQEAQLVLMGTLD